MPRQARQKSETGIYHIIIRGNNRQAVFFEEQDYNRFLFTLQKFKPISGYKLYSYCLMRNHAHMLIKTGEEALEQVMRRICSSFVHWYNQKYDRIGNLFQDRFKSEPINDDTYWFTVLRYIHQNPIKAKIVQSPEEYHWSSYKAYLDPHTDFAEILDIDDVLSFFDDKPKKAIQSFVKYHQVFSEDDCLDISNADRISEKQAIRYILLAFSIKQLSDISLLDQKKRDHGLRKLKQHRRLSIRRIEQITGINRGVVERA